MGILSATNIVQSYDRAIILKNIELEINPGEVLAFIGPTGAGKTTLLRILGLLELPFSGEIIFHGTNITRSTTLRQEARRRISFVQQKPIVFTMSVYDNIAVGLKIRREHNAIIKQKVSRVLDLIGMTDFKYRQAKSLSGGETQRVAIARALVTEPEILYLDEPTANLDPISTSKIEEVLEYVIQQRKTTVVMTTHDMSQGQRIADRIGVIINGEINQIGNTEEIFCLPHSKEAAEFVGIQNIVSGVIIDKEDTLVSIRVKDKIIEAISSCVIGDKVYVIFRAEDVVFSRLRDKSSARNVFEGKITRIYPECALVRFEVDCGFPVFGITTRRSAEELNLAAECTVYVSFKASALHVIKRPN